jgi:3-oxoacyl-[acyl-carrier protein] reductase
MKKNYNPLEERHPLNSIGDPVKVAKVIYNLFSAKEDWITGQTISIDGGLSSLR